MNAQLCCHRRRRSAIAASVMIAALVPSVWMFAVAGPARGSTPFGSADAQWLVRVSVASGLLWGGIAHWLLRGSSPRSTGTALSIGLLSPILGGVLLMLLGLPLYFIELVTGGVMTAGTTGWLGIATVKGVFLAPQLFLPVGIGMGLLVHCITRTAWHQTPPSMAVD